MSAYDLSEYNELNAWMCYGEAVTFSEQTLII
jgi:hypothetical protein